MRAVVDNNVWVSATVKPAGSCRAVLRACIDGRFQLVTREPLLEELADVLSRPRLARKYGLTADDARELVAILAEVADIPEVTGAAHGCRDPRDDIAMETALRGGATCIVSGDRDLTADEDLHRYLALGGVSVLTVCQLLAELEPEGNER